MLGKGSVNHNSRQFKATNIDSERTQFNISYWNTPIKEVYHELFDEALQRYNAKQKRADRCIDDYYEKIRTGKQEKLFCEVIFQVGNKENMAVESEDGQLAAKVLDEFMQSFQERNPYLKVFSAHLHMDEATRTFMWILCRSQLTANAVSTPVFRSTGACQSRLCRRYPWRHRMEPVGQVREGSALAGDGTQQHRVGATRHS